MFPLDSTISGGVASHNLFQSTLGDHMRTKRTRGPRTSPDVRDAIEQLAAAGNSNADIQLLLDRDERFKGRVPVSLVTVGRIARAARQRDAQPFSLLTFDADDARLVLPVLAHLRTVTDAPWALTQDVARWIVRVRKAAPDVAPYTAFQFAIRYLSAQTRPVEMSARMPPISDLDTALAIAQKEAQSQ